MPKRASESSTIGSNKAKKQLSCQRCRTRKVKCNYEIPCSQCVKAGKECIQVANDLRKIRPSATYVSELEGKYDHLYKILIELKQRESIEAKANFLNSIDFDSIQAPKHDTVIEHHDDIEENSAFYGPTSVYDDHIITNNSNSVKKDKEVNEINILNKDKDVLNCLQLFFTWQYPDHNMFIFREAFLIDFFDPKPTMLYCSKVLILSICALGARMSDDEKVYKKSKQYYNESKKILLSTFSQPSITSLQSYMLLAFFDICNGLNSSGWMLSGNAMRMGFDLGFQLNPEVWFVESKGNLSKLDVDIRSRIYWGCYMADHFISLLLGRPSLLKISDASIPETNDLPDLEWIDDFTYEGHLKNKGLEKPKSNISYISDPLKKIINLINISDNMLNDIFTKSETIDDDDLNLESRLEKLSEYNTQIMHWKDTLPHDLQWDRKKLSATGDNPTYSGIRYYYYILILCLNRPFVGIDHEKNKYSPLLICQNAIDDLYQSINKFQSEHGYKTVSIFIVYSSILSISIILLTNKSIKLESEEKERLQFFMGVLQGCSKTWKLAEKSYNLIKDKLRHRNDAGELLEPSVKIETPKSTDLNSVDSINAEILFDENLDFLGGPPVLMTSDLFNEDWEALFPDYIFHSKN
ncbi:unnamed protein product [Candida verbasci]|uniref:Zn(2)-C6 fungal-type domain-containing protein n=1 Tax=Candida verbasci TaxID=1227364 RepID=A0A9W4XDQ1_9ASCO|nr:unnamed protein product [Candida verbasci]